MVIDLLFAIAALYGFWIGYSRGIIQTIFRILAYVIGLMAAFRFAPAMTDFLESVFSNTNPLMFVAGFLLSFVLTMLFIRLLARGLEGLLEAGNINVINQVAGGLLLASVLVLVYSVIVWFADSSKIISEQTKRESYTYEYLEVYPTYVWEVGKHVKPVFQDFWDHTVDFLDRVEDMDMGIEKTESEPSFYDLEEQENGYYSPAEENTSGN